MRCTCEPGEAIRRAMASTGSVVTPGAFGCRRTASDRSSWYRANLAVDSLPENQRAVGSEPSNESNLRVFGSVRRRAHLMVEICGVSMIRDQGAEEWDDCHGVALGECRVNAAEVLQ